MSNIIPRAEHSFSRKLVSKNALTVLYRLHEAGFQAYLVGGCVRDILLGLKPKDFDVATNATPDEVRSLFRNCRLIGRRFRLAHIYFGRDIIEVATFRGKPSDDETESAHSESGRILRDNVYGDITSDALRRDFTINALYYNIADFSIVDYCKGIDDINQRTLTLIGDPEVRYREDPVRLLRALRFAAKLGLTISPATSEHISSSLDLLNDVPKSRIYEECLKLFLNGHAVASLNKLREYKVERLLFPPTKHYEDNDWKLITQGFMATDTRVQSHQTTSPGFLFAVLLWPGYMHYSSRMGENMPHNLTLKYEIMDKLFHDVHQGVAIPKRFTLICRSVWELQDRLINLKRHHVFRLLSHPSFRAGFDFLKLRSLFDPSLKDITQWWEAFQTADNGQQDEMLLSLQTGKGRRKKPRKKKKKEDA